MVLEKARLRMNDISLKRIVYEEHESAWGRGEIDALVTYEPVAGRLKAREPPVLSSANWPTRFLTCWPSGQTWPAHAEHAARHPGRSISRALRYMRQNPWDAPTGWPRAGCYRRGNDLLPARPGVARFGRQPALPVGSSGELWRCTKTLPLMQQAGLIAAPSIPQALFQRLFAWRQSVKRLALCPCMAGDGPACAGQ